MSAKPDDAKETEPADALPEEVADAAGVTDTPEPDGGENQPADDGRASSPADAAGVTDTLEPDGGGNQPADDGRTSSPADEGAPKEAGTQRRGGRTSSKGIYAALIATVGVAAFFAGLAVPVLNQDPITMSDLNQAVEFLEDKIDRLSSDLQELEDTMLTDPSAPDTSSPQPTISADDDPVLGNPDAPITIIEFSDFQCPFCARFYSETLPHIIENYVDTDQVKLVYRDFPLQNIHPNAVPAAVAAECAHEQGSYWEYHDTLFENVAVWGDLDLVAAVDQLKAYAAEMGLDEGSFAECLDTGRYVSEVTNDYTDGASYGVSGTPAFFVGNDQVGYYFISGARPYSEFQFAIEQILSSIEQ